MEQRGETTRERLLRAAAELLAEQGVSVSTRAICTAAGVTAPTLYHYFGDREGLLQAVVTYGFANYLASKRTLEQTGDPIQDIRNGWADHQQWGTSNPSFYALMYGQVVPGHHPSAGEAERMLLAKLEASARAGLLRVPPPVAMRMILSANIGLTLTMISQPGAVPDDVSERLIGSLLASVTVHDAVPGQATDATSSAARSAIALQAALAAEPSTELSAAELPLLESWLDRLSAPSGS